MPRFFIVPNKISVNKSQGSKNTWGRRLIAWLTPPSMVRLSFAIFPMPVNSAQRFQQMRLSSRFFIGAMLAVSILWLLALSTASDAGTYHHAERKSISASYDMPLHIPAEHSRALKRFFKRTSNYPTTDLSPHFSATETPAALWVLIASEFVVAPSLTAEFSAADSLSPRVYLQQLQSLDSPRAPPFV